MSPSEAIAQESEPAEVAEAIPAPTVERCLNCENPQQGPYCHLCGQRFGHPHPTLKELLHDVVEEVFHLDAKLPRTVKALMKPGALTAEYLQGRRARYVKPFTLYVAVSALYFGVASLVPERPTTPVQIARVENGQHLTEDQAVDKGLKEFRAALQKSGSRSAVTFFNRAEPHLRRFAEGGAQGTTVRVTEGMNRYLPDAMFFLLPLFAALLTALRVRAEDTYVQHFVFSLHFHTSAFLLLLPAQFLSEVLKSWVELGLLVYLFLALRRVYQRSRLTTLWKLFALLFCYSLFWGATVMGIICFVIWRS